MQYFRPDSYGTTAVNMIFDYPNANLDRPRSLLESYIRMGMNICPAGRIIDGFANGVEFYAHRTQDNYNAYYQNNARGYNDHFDRSWDAFKRATDIDYS